MEVMMPSPVYVSPPPYYFSAPTSPSRFYKDSDEFAFDVGEDIEITTSLSSADELFEGGVIRPSKLPQVPRDGNSRIITSPPHKYKELMEPYAAQNVAKVAGSPQRGRRRSGHLSKTSSRRVARSLSPIRDSQNPFEEEEDEENDQQNDHKTITTTNSSVSSTLAAFTKWKFKDFFLFRSASEGRADNKDPLRKYTASLRRPSFRVPDSPGSVSGSRRRGHVSAHELHYTMNRAVSEDLKKKTFLPYKQGILGKLAFNPAVHALANGFGFSRK